MILQECQIRVKIGHNTESYNFSILTSDLYNLEKEKKDVESYFKEKFPNGIISWKENV